MTEESKITLVFGASEKAIRYSNIAMRKLVSYKQETVAIGARKGIAHGIDIMKGHPDLLNIDTITIYMGEARQKEHEDYLLSLKPRRIIFNPGAENLPFYLRARKEGVEVLNACTLVMLSTGQY